MSPMYSSAVCSLLLLATSWGENLSGRLRAWTFNKSLREVPWNHLHLYRRPRHTRSSKPQLLTLRTAFSLPPCGPLEAQGNGWSGLGEEVLSPQHTRSEGSGSHWLRPKEEAPTRGAGARRRVEISPSRLLHAHLCANLAGPRVCQAEDLQLCPSRSQGWVKAEGRLVLPGVGRSHFSPPPPHLHCILATRSRNENLCKIRGGDAQTWDLAFRSCCGQTCVGHFLPFPSLHPNVQVPLSLRP